MEKKQFWIKNLSLASADTGLLDKVLRASGFRSEPPRNSETTPSSSSALFSSLVPPNPDRMIGFTDGTPYPSQFGKIFTAPIREENKQRKKRISTDFDNPVPVELNWMQRADLNPEAFNISKPYQPPKKKRRRW